MTIILKFLRSLISLLFYTEQKCNLQSCETNTHLYHCSNVINQVRNMNSISTSG